MEKSTEEHRVEVPIQSFGSFFELDEDGYIVNPTSAEKIQEEWKPVLDEVIDAYKKEYGDHLVSIFVRGSVAKGEAVKNISDVDSFAYVDLPQEKISHKWTGEVERKIIEEYPFVGGVELSVDPVEDASNDHILLIQSLCIYGDDISKSLPKLKPGKEMSIHLPNLSKNLEWFEKKLEKIEGDKEELKQACTWFTKNLLRAGFELTMERSHKYTRDLYLCYKTFSEYYPEKESEMKEVLYLALNPIADEKKLKELRSGLGAWIQKEAQMAVEA